MASLPKRLIKRKAPRLRPLGLKLFPGIKPKKPLLPIRPRIRASLPSTTEYIAPKAATSEADTEVSNETESTYRPLRYLRAATSTLRRPKLPRPRGVRRRLGLARRLIRRRAV